MKFADLLTINEDVAFIGGITVGDTIDFANDLLEKLNMPISKRKDCAQVEFKNLEDKSVKFVRLKLEFTENIVKRILLEGTFSQFTKEIDDEFEKRIKNMSGNDNWNLEYDTGWIDENHGDFQYKGRESVEENGYFSIAYRAEVGYENISRVGIELNIQGGLYGNYEKKLEDEIYNYVQEFRNYQEVLKQRKQQAEHVNYKAEQTASNNNHEEIRTLRASSLDQIEFTISRTELMEALKMLSPFIVIKKKEDEAYEDSEMSLPEPYFYDKVTFLLYKEHACLSVLTKEGVKIERTCHVESNIENVSFCMPHAYLLQEVTKDIHEAEVYSFKEDRFFGFNVFDAISGKYFFDVDAHSVSKQPSIHPKYYDKLYPNTVSFEHKILLKVLKEFSEYSHENCLYPIYDNIFLCINNGECRAFATAGSTLIKKTFQTEVKSTHTFSIPGKFAKRVYDIIANWKEYTYTQIEYNDTYLRLYYFSRKDRFGDSIEVPLNKSEIPIIEKVLAKQNITHRSSLRLEDIKTVFRKMNALKYKDDFVIMHFFLDHVNIHCRDTCFDQSISEFYDTLECDGKYVVSLHQKTLEDILDDIYTDNVIFTLVNDNLLYVNNDDEELFGDVIRIICTANILDEDQEFLERADDSLRTHQNYIEKYLTMNDDNDEEYDNDDDDISDSSIATVDEMREEAIRRMKEVIDYTDIIDFFEETGLPQVYEPPYGASYSLEDDELENVRTVERNRDVLVWGVIRCNMMYNRQEVTVDSMLYVSQYKNDWEQEREDLLNGLPSVYTVMKEYPVTDSGCISVYKSEGGTLLRQHN